MMHIEGEPWESPKVDIQKKVKAQPVCNQEEKVTHGLSGYTTQYLVGATLIPHPNIRSLLQRHSDAPLHAVAEVNDLSNDSRVP